MIEKGIENPCIMPIYKLLGENFLIPRYQRGYRWGKQEITELLDDILQYYQLTSDRENKVSKFYCLQPIVVKKKIRERKNQEKNETIEEWELIDGQQRLTTLFIILSYLEDVRKLLKKDSDTIYSIDFETRNNCKYFFNNKEFAKEIDFSNVDFYHISKGYEFVKEWFDKNDQKVEILNTILKEEYNVSVIWYETKNEIGQIDFESSSIDLFTRLNEGKIPLTDAELIKALLLQGDRYPFDDQKYVRQRLFEIASEWDEIEAKFQDEKMWYFLNDTNYQPSSKIEFIFKLLAEKWNEGNSKKYIQYEDKEGIPKHFEYLVFDKHLLKKRNDFKENKDPNKDILDPVNEIWKDIKEVFSIFYEWYEDHSLYHYIGFLIAIDNANKEKLIKELLTKKLKKTDFIKFLKIKIANAINFKKIKKENSSEYKSLSDYSYGDDNKEILRILLIFNIETLIKQNIENARFPFHLYKKEKISSIEHIHPQNPEDIDTDQERSKVWLVSHKNALVLLRQKEVYNKGIIDKYISDIDTLLGRFDKEKFKNVYNDIIDLYTQIAEIKEKEVHTLYNLALVDKDTNSALNNSFFDIKRQILKENKLGKYIPICTQRIFSKYYSSNPEEMIFWGDNDRKSYFKEIEAMYNSFIKLLN